MRAIWRILDINGYGSWRLTAWEAEIDGERSLFGDTLHYSNDYLRGIHRQPSRFYQLAGDWQTYLKMAYLMSALPRGIVYFCILITGLFFGLLLLPLFLFGIPILVAVDLIARRFGAFERDLAYAWLGVEIPPPTSLGLHGATWRQQARARFGDQVTWTNLLFLLIKLPLGMVTCVIASAAFWFPGWLIGHAIGGFLGITPPWFGTFGGIIQLAAGVAAFFLGLHLINLTASGAGWFARVMLGPSEAERRAAISEARAQRERAKAERADQSRHELIVNVSHELRTPTTSIRGHVESLMIQMEESGEQNGTMPSDQLYHHLEIIHRETERLSALIDDLLSLARMEADELRLVVSPVDAAAVVEEVHEALTPMAWRERNVTLVHEIVPGAPLVLADRDRLAQVLLNLVRNAIVYTPAGGIVSIQLRPSGSRVEIAVADTGAGIPPEDLERIFDRFYRVETSRSRTTGGFGLGLSIVQDLVTAMGGTVTVESTVGEGSVFHVWLNAAIGSKQEASKATGKPAAD